jgi:hypothetical protein
MLLLSAVVVGSVLACAPAAVAQTGSADSLVVTGATEEGDFFFETIDVSASSGPSGESPSGRAFFVVAPFGFTVGSQTTDNVTCLSVREDAATVVFRDGGFGTVVVEAVDGGPGFGSDRFVAVPETRSETDCSPLLGFPPQALTRGDVIITDAPPLPTSKDQCKNGDWRNYGTTFRNQGQCVAFVQRGPKT